MVKCPRCGYDNNSINTYCENCSYPIHNSDSSFNERQKQRQGWNLSIGKKILLVIGIVIIALLLFSFIYNVSQPDKDSSLNVVTANESQQYSSSMPFKVNVIYNGSWYGKMGDPNYLIEHSGTGDGSYRLDCTSWDKISVTVQKQDYSSNNLTVQLLRNGKVVGQNSTTDEMGTVTLSYN